MPFVCSICGEEATRICARCTKDACNNHLCEKCLRCSDCCECELSATEPVLGPSIVASRAHVESSAPHPPAPEPQMETPQPPPDPDPFPPDEAEPVPPVA